MEKSKSSRRHYDAQFRLNAVQLVNKSGRSTTGLIHHSDWGSQSAGNDYREALRQAGITAGMSRKGNCYDNAAMASFFASLKTEVFDRGVAQTRREAELLVFDSIETFYNPSRLHS